MKAFFLLLLGTFCLAQDLHRLELTPIALDYGENLDLHPSGVSSLYTDGERIYIRSVSDPKIFIVNSSGKVLETVGNRGRGPGEFNSGIMAFAVHGDHIWAQGVTRRKTVQHFYKGQYQDAFQLDGYNVRRNSPGANTMIANKRLVLVPTHPSTGKLATVYFRDGSTKQVGDLIVQRIQVEMLRKTPAINDTHWVYDGTHYYCIPKYHPLVIKYDNNFDEIDRFNLDLHAPIQMLFHEIIGEFEPTESMKWALPLFTDVQVWNGSLFLMSKFHMFRIGARNGAFQSLYTFHGKEPLPEGNLNILSFAILNNGDLILRGSSSWDTFLWRSRLPSESY